MEPDEREDRRRKRRNLVLLSALIILVYAAGIELPDRLSIFGIQFGVIAPKIMVAFMWIVFGYWLLLYIQHFQQRSKAEWITEVNRRSVEIEKRKMIRDFRRENPQHKDSNLKMLFQDIDAANMHGTILTIRNKLVREDGAYAEAPEEARLRLTVDIKDIEKHRWCARIQAAFVHTYAAQHYLPLVIATLAVLTFVINFAFTGTLTPWQSAKYFIFP